MMAVQCVWNVERRLFASHYVKSLFSFYYQHVRNAKRYITIPPVKKSLTSKPKHKHPAAFQSYHEVQEKQKEAAQRTIFVQTSAQLNAYELYTYCQQFGQVKQMCRSGKDEQKEYFLVEFENSKTMEELLKTCRHFDHPDLIPLHSRNLFFLCHAQVKEKPIPVKLQEDDNFSPSQLNIQLQKFTSMSAQMDLIYQTQRLSNVGERLRHFICCQLEESLFSLFPQCKVYPFGSTTNGFGKIGCDLDMVLELCSKSNTPNSRLLFKTKKISVQNNNDNRIQAQRVLEVLAEMIQSFFPNCNYVQRILSARVPIVKFNHSGVDCDLSVSNMNGVWMSELLFTFGAMDPRVRPLVFTIHKWAASNHVTNDVPGHWITNFTLTVLVVFFLQNRKIAILPSIKELVKLTGNKKMHTFENLSQLPVSRNTESLEDLLYDFFSFYERFDFRTMGISLIDACSFTKQTSSPLYIQYPYDLKFNISKNVTHDEFSRIRTLMQTTLRKLDDNNNDGSSKDGNKCGVLKLFSLPQSEADKITTVQVKSFFDDKDGSIEKGHTKNSISKEKNIEINNNLDCQIASSNDRLVESTTEPDTSSHQSINSVKTMGPLMHSIAYKRFTKRKKLQESNQRKKNKAVTWDDW